MFKLPFHTGYIPQEFYDRFKILSLSKSIFAWLMSIAYSSQLIYRMANRTFRLPFTDMKSLFNQTSYKLVISSGSMVYEMMEKESDQLLQ